MIKTYTIEEAISKEFDIKDVPTFTDFKPFRQAREWLDSKKIKYVYERQVARKGIVVYGFGSSNPQITVLDSDDTKSLHGAQIFASLSAVTEKDDDKKPTPRKK